MADKMTEAIKLIGLVLVIWLPFSIACIAAIPISLYGVLITKNEYAKNVLRCMDKLLSALCGFGGYYTLSAELHYAAGAWTLLRRLLDLIQAGHCEKAAAIEGLKKP